MLKTIARFAALATLGLAVSTQAADTIKIGLVNETTGPMRKRGSSP